MRTKRILALTTVAAVVAVGASLAAGMVVGPRAQPSAAVTTQGPSGSGTGGRVGGDTGSGHLPGLAEAGGSGEQVPPALPPAAGYREGGLVTGYPGRVIPAVPGTMGLSTSVVPSGRRFQAALVGRLDDDPASVLRFYQTRLTRLGFTAEERPAVPGSTALRFTRSDGSVVVTATPDHPTSYSVFAVLTVGGT